MKRYLPLCLAALSLAVLGATQTSAAPILGEADIILVVDESGSMGGEHAWIPGMITALEAGLNTAGVGTGSNSNQYGVVGFGSSPHNGSSQLAHKHLYGGNEFGSAATVSGGTGLVASGGFEDGWQAIEFALANYTLRSGAATNIILITDEDRDNSSSSITSTTVLAALSAENAILNSVVSFNFEDGGGTSAIGVDSAGDAYLADGSGGFTTSSGGVATTGFGTTKADYIDLAWATGGAGWNLQKLRAGGNTATSFTAAFVDIKVAEIVVQVTTVPEPSSLAIFSLFGLVGACYAVRRNRKSA